MGHLTESEKVGLMGLCLMREMLMEFARALLMGLGFRLDWQMEPEKEQERGAHSEKD